MAYRDRPAQSAPRRGRGGAAYRRAVDEVRQRVADGEVCWFYRRPGFEECPGWINLDLHHQDRWAFTAHHLHRLMDGGGAVVDPRLMAPAHRACNASDGLRAQNARRAGLGPPSVPVSVRVVAGEPPRDRTSQAW
jgi:hypothetical protein